MTDLAEWGSFYGITGTAAGTLIGLQFVVMTLIADRPPPRAAEAGPVFATPTIVHFSIALLLSALMLVPWHAMTPAAALWALTGFGGAVYMAGVGFMMRKQTAYGPDIEDKLFHFLLPLLAYAVLALAAIAALLHPREALFGIAASIVLLLFIGIHNTWDSVSYMVFVKNPNAQPEQDNPSVKKNQ